MEHLLNENLLKYFTQYALQEGSTSALSIGGLKNLLQNQFAQYLKKSSNNKFVCRRLWHQNKSISKHNRLLQNMQRCMDQFSLDNIIKSLDKNKDGSVSFDEFIMIVKRITSPGQ